MRACRWPANRTHWCSREIQRKQWPELLRRVFAVEVLACRFCGGERRIIAEVEEGPIARRILAHLRLPTTAPKPAQGKLFSTGPPPVDVDAHLEPRDLGRAGREPFRHKCTSMCGDSSCCAPRTSRSVSRGSGRASTDNLVKAVAEQSFSPALKDGLREQEARLHELESSRKEVQGSGKVLHLPTPADARAYVDDFLATLTTDPARGNVLLRKHVTDAWVACHLEGDHRVFVFEGVFDLAPIMVEAERPPGGGGGKGGGSSGRRGPNTLRIVSGNSLIQACRPQLQSPPRESSSRPDHRPWMSLRRPSSGPTRTTTSASPTPTRSPEDPLHDFANRPSVLGWRSASPLRAWPVLRQRKPPSGHRPRRSLAKFEIPFRFPPKESAA